MERGGHLCRPIQRKRKKQKRKKGKDDLSFY